jgi:nucleoid-associated protein YgaU
MLTKLKIQAYSDKELRSKVADYSLQINPETYGHTHAAVFARAAGNDTGGTILKFSTQAPEELKFDFVLDGTGVVPGVKSVADEIKRFKSVAYDYQGSIHSPNYLRILWGGLAFDCMLSSLSIAYQLFDPAGKPLRCKVSASFRQHQTPEDLTRLADKKSADLTHSETVTAGDSLPLMTYRVYDRSDLYVHVARANDLNTLMSLRPGAVLRFPPAGT